MGAGGLAGAGSAGVGAGGTGVWGNMTVPQLVTRGAGLASMMRGREGKQAARPDDSNVSLNFLNPNAQGPLVPAQGVSLRNQMLGNMRAIQNSPRFQHFVGSMANTLSNYGNQYKAPDGMMHHQNLALLLRQLLREPPQQYQYNPGQIGENIVNGAGNFLKYLPMLFR